MITIKKYPITIVEQQTLCVLAGSLLSLGLDCNNEPCLFVHGDDKLDRTLIDIFLYKDGDIMPNEPMIHIGSFPKAPIDWHVFMKE